jgi:hypothetical protein
LALHVRKVTLIGSLGLALVGAGAFALAAAGGGKSSGVNVLQANAATARASSVHYSFTVKLQKKQPLVLHISGGASRDAIAVHLRLADITLSDDTTMPGATGAVMLKSPFLYERAPDGVAVYDTIRWLRLPILGKSPRSQVLSTVRSMTPSPLLRIVAESRLHAVSTTGGFAGTVAYDDPVVRTALHTLGGGLEFRNLHVFVAVGTDDGLVHRIRLTGRTADGKTRFSLHARLYGFGAPVTVKPPKPGTFMDEQLARLAA